MPDDPATEPAEPSGGSPGAAGPSGGSAGAAGPAEPGVDRAAARRQEVVVAGHRGDEAGARAALGDPDGSVRAAAVGALARMGALGVADLLAALDDPSPVVRRRAVGEAANAATGEAALGTALRAALEDADPLVAEAACWALGEWRTTAAVGALGAVARDHGDTRCREAAVAALGAVGDRSGLPAVLGALDDKPTVRRRAVVALAAFDGPEVDDALRRSLDDRDWQVREAAAILLDP